MKNQKVPNENVEIYNELENIISRANILMKDIHNK
jgi:hypothetical protein